MKIVYVLMFFLLVSCTQSSPNITGQIDQWCGDKNIPLPNALVVLRHNNKSAAVTHTGNDGKYEFLSLDPSLFYMVDIYYIDKYGMLDNLVGEPVELDGGDVTLKHNVIDCYMEE
jgi:hypothetical protein